MPNESNSTVLHVEDRKTTRVNWSLTSGEWEEDSKHLDAIFFFKLFRNTLCLYIDTHRGWYHYWSCTVNTSWAVLTTRKWWAKRMECTSLFVKLGVNYPQAIISRKLMKFTVLYIATLTGAKRLLRKSWSRRWQHPVTVVEKTVINKTSIILHFKNWWHPTWHPSSLHTVSSLLSPVPKLW